MKLSKEKLHYYLREAFLECSDPPTVHLFDSLASTNQWLKENGQCGEVCLAEQQTAGRGRRGNQWLSPDAENIYLSLVGCFKQRPPYLSLLSLVVGVSIARTLEKIGVVGHGVKWPNDIYWQGLKMGGILIESVTSATSADAGLRVVIGIGLNINMPPSVGASIDQPWTSVAQVLGQRVNRHQLIALLVEQLITDLQRFEQLNLADFKQQWQRWDVLNHQPVSILREHEELEGIVQGLDAQGRIGILLDSGQLHYFSSADIRLKK